MTQNISKSEDITEPDQRMSVEEAFSYCTRLALAHYENFPVGGKWIPRRLRKHVHAIYAFARIADDYSDEAEHEGQRLEKLDAWREQLAACYQGQASHPVFIALRETAREFDIPEKLLADLLDAFRQDCVKSRYRNFDEVLDYCRRSANPVGRLVLLLFGYKEERLHELSDFICTGLQLANFWQDVAIDLKKDRIYLPEDERGHFGVDQADLESGIMNDRLRTLMDFQVRRTWEFFSMGRPLPECVHWPLSLELKLVWLGGTRILEKLERNQFDFFNARPVIHTGDKLLLLGRALFWKRMRTKSA